MRDGERVAPTGGPHDLVVAPPLRRRPGPLIGTDQAERRDDASVVSQAVGQVRQVQERAGSSATKARLHIFSLKFRCREQAKLLVVAEMFANERIRRALGPAK